MGADIELLLQHCQKLEFPDKGLMVLNATQELVGEGLCKATERLSYWLSTQGFRRLLLYYPGCNGEPYEFDDSFAQKVVVQASSGNAIQAQAAQSSSLSSSGDRSRDVDISGLNLPSTYLRDASYQQVEEFIREMENRGYIVTVTDMVTNKCMRFNELQVIDRGGNWTGANWAGLNFLELWVDSFKPRNHNYFGDLVSRVENELYIQNFEYLLRAPNKDLRRYYSWYFYAQSFLGTPVRICVSVPGNWELVEVKENLPA